MRYDIIVPMEVALKQKAIKLWLIMIETMCVEHGNQR
jgi:hypothetical protein